MIVSVIVAVLNALGALLPQLPGLIDAVRAHPALDDGGKAALDLVDSRLDADEKAVDAVQPLAEPSAAMPDPKPAS